MALRLKNADRNTPLLLPPDLRDWVAEDDLARFRRRISIEPLIGHLKGQYRLARCFLKGFVGDPVNLLLAAAAWNLRKWLRAAALSWLQILRAWFPSMEPPLRYGSP